MAISTSSLYKACVMYNGTPQCDWYEFGTMDGFTGWFDTVAGEQDASTSYATVRKWLRLADAGDALYLDDALRMTTKADADVEIHCIIAV